MTKFLRTSESEEKEIHFFFNGQKLQARQGMSVAAALIQNDERATRITRINQLPRGVFCGIGICFDCLVVIDGVSNQRSCLVEVGQGMNVETQSGAGEATQAVQS